VFCGAVDAVTWHVLPFYPEQWQVTVHQLEERVETLKRLWAVLPFFCFRNQHLPFCNQFGLVNHSYIMEDVRKDHSCSSQAVQVVKRTRLKSVKFLKFTLQARRKAQLHTIITVQYLWRVSLYWDFRLLSHSNQGCKLCARLGGLICFSTSGRMSYFFPGSRCNALEPISKGETAFYFMHGKTHNERKII